ncbi:MAG: hypothetical protein RLZZ175_250 [Bacteroidota bacterium]|jgi:hypothetical protein
MFKNIDEKKLKIVIYSILFFIYIVLMFLPKTFFDKGKSLCVSKVFFDIECYGCGLTRGIQHLIHFDFEGAYYYNKLSFLVLPLIIYLILKDLYELFFKKVDIENSDENLD